LKEPRAVKLVKATINSKEVGKVFKADAKGIKEYIEEADEEVKQKLCTELNENSKFTINVNGKNLELTKDHVTMEVVDKVIQEEKYTPSVIEPSFGKFLWLLILSIRYWQNRILYI